MADDRLGLSDDRLDELGDAGEIVDQGLRLASPPHTVVHSSLGQHFAAASYARGEVGDGLKRCPWLASDLLDSLGDGVAGDACGIAEVAEHQHRISFRVRQDLRLHVRVDGGFDRCHEPGAHVHAAGAERERGHQTAPVCDPATGDHRDIECVYGRGREYQAGDVILAGVTGALRGFGDLDIAEEAAAEAFAAAVERWPTDGVPPNPGGWLTTTANRKAIDRIRRESKRADKHREALMLREDEPVGQVGAIADDRLRLIFTCCHPALAIEARTVLTLRLIGGLTVPEIARAFLVSESTMGKRITRAKAKIKAARVPYRIPAAEDLPARVSGVLAVLYLVFNEGYLASGPDSDPIRPALTRQAIRLTRLVRELLPHDGEVTGLLALMLLTEARGAARISACGELVALAEQDRGAWDTELIAEGHQLVRDRLAAAAAGEAPGRYQILAAIGSVHTSVPDIRDTDWSQILALYDQLLQVDPAPLVTLNRAVAVAELDGPVVALTIVDRLADTLGEYHAFHATRADLLRRLGRSRESRAAYTRAIELAGNTGETAYLTRRRDQLR